MRIIVWILIFTAPAGILAQGRQSDLEKRIKAVENSLAPEIVYGDKVPNWNLEERMQSAGVKGLSIAVIHNFNIEWAKGYGWADEASGRKVTPDTRFQAASISKSINSLGILKLAEQGKLDLDADINKYLKSWKFPYDSLSEGKIITTKNLLSHTAGLDVHGFPGYKRWDSLPSITQVLDGQRPANTRKVRSLLAPGEIVKYSGGGTTISQLMLMDITGRDYAAFMQAEVLEPLGMKQSSFRQPPADTTNLATGYYRNGQPVQGKYHIYPEQAAAGLWTTPSDLAKYIIECQLAYAGKSKKVLSRDMMRRRMTPVLDSNAALGVFIIDKKGTSYFNHNGGNEAFLCTSYGNLADGNGVVIMINGENFGVVRELLNSVAMVYNWKDFYTPKFRKLVSLPPSQMLQYTGDYRLGNDDSLKVTVCGKELCISQGAQPPPGFTLLFTDETHFEIAEVPNAFFSIIKNERGEVEALELTQNGMKMKLPRIR